MHLTVFTEAGEGIGWGHFHRCFAVAEAFVEMNYIVRFVVRGIKKLDYRPFSVQTEFCDWANDQELLGSLVESTDVALVDSYHAKTDVYRHVADCVDKVIYFDDSVRISYPAGIVINASIIAEQLRYPVRDWIVYLTGPRYAPLRSSFWEVSKKTIKRKINNVLVYMSAGDPRNLISLICNAVQRIVGHVDIVVVGGKKRFYGSQVRNIVSIDCEGMVKLMEQSDIAITAGGQFIYELARIGVPTVTVAIAENQLHNVNGWKEIGFTEHAGWWQENSLADRLSTSITNLIEYSERKRRSSLGRSLVDGQGARRIACEIKKRG